MKLLILLLLVSSTVFSQSTYYLRADSIRFQKVPSTSNSTTFILENATRYKTGGYLRNRTDGRTDFYYAIDSASVSGGNLTLWRGGGTQNIVVGVGGAQGLQSVITTDPVLTQDNVIDAGAFLVKWQDILDFEINRWGHEGFYFGQRIASIGMPVVRMKPRNGNTQMSFDIYPRGSPNDTFNVGVAWLDVVNKDFDSVAAGNTAKLFAGVNWVGVGQSNYGVAAVPFLFTMGDGITIGSMNTDSSWTIGRTNKNNVRFWKDSTVFFTGSGVTETMRITNAGLVGIGTSTPAKTFHTVGTVRHVSLGTASGDTTTYKPLGIDANGDVFPITYWPGGGAGATPTLQQVLDAGSTLTSSETITVDANTLNLTGSGFVFNLTGGSVASQLTGSSKGALIDANSATTNAMVRPLSVRAYSTGTTTAGFGAGIEFNTEIESGVAATSFYDVRMTNIGSLTYANEIDIWGYDAGASETFMNIQPSGVVRVNNLADTLATKAYARSVGGGAGSQTPWTSDIDADQFSLTDVDKIGLVTTNSTTLTNFTQAVTNPAYLITTTHTDQAYAPGMFWNTSDDNATKPKAGIYVQYDNTNGAYLNFGISGGYSTGITQTGLTLSPVGAHQMNGTTLASLKLNTTDANSEAAALIAGSVGSVFEYSSSGFFDIVSATKANVGVGSGTSRLNITGAGVVTISDLGGSGSRAVLADAAGVLTAPVSDRKAKENIRPLETGIGTIMKLKPSTFYFRDRYKNHGATQQVGFIAQDIAEVLPNSAFITPSTGLMGYKSEDLIPVLVRAVQEQQKQIDELKELVKILIQKK